MCQTHDDNTPISMQEFLACKECLAQPPRETPVQLAQRRLRLATESIAKIRQNLEKTAQLEPNLLIGEDFLSEAEELLLKMQQEYGQAQEDTLIDRKVRVHVDTIRSLSDKLERLRRQSDRNLKRARLHANPPKLSGADFYAWRKSLQARRRQDNDAI